MERVILSPAIWRISATISSLVLPSRVMTCTQRDLEREAVFSDATAMTQRPQLVAIYVANCPVTVDPPQIKRYPQIEGVEEG